LDRYRTGITPAEARRRLDLPSESPLVAWIGRFNFQKDPLTFVHAARRVVDAIPDVRFVLCGDDPLGHDLWPKVESLALTLGIRDRFIVLGFRSDLPIVLTAVDLLMHSSRYEGMGRVVCEALACERAVAGTAVDGVREVIDSGTRGGILVPPRNPEALALAAIELLTDRARARALARAGRDWVERHLPASIMVERTAELYTRLLSRPVAGRRAARRSVALEVASTVVEPRDSLPSPIAQTP
jgi:glycosyltransferase involved in cell wall biosynthesis